MHHCAIVPLRHRAIVPLRDRVLSACSIRPDVARGLIRWDELCALREFGLRAHGAARRLPGEAAGIGAPLIRFPGMRPRSVFRALLKLEYDLHRGSTRVQAGMQPASGFRASPSWNTACIGSPRAFKLEYGPHRGFAYPQA